MGERGRRPAGVGIRGNAQREAGPGLRRQHGSGNFGANVALRGGRGELFSFDAGNLIEVRRFPRLPHIARERQYQVEQAPPCDGEPKPYRLSPPVEGAPVARRHPGTKGHEKDRRDGDSQDSEAERGYQSPAADVHRPAAAKRGQRQEQEPAERPPSPEVHQSAGEKRNAPWPFRTRQILPVLPVVAHTSSPNLLSDYTRRNLSRLPPTGFSLDRLSAGPA